MSTEMLINLGATLAAAAILTALFYRFAWNDTRAQAIASMYGSPKVTAAFFTAFGLLLLALAFVFMDHGGCPDCSVTPNAHRLHRARPLGEGGSLVIYLTTLVFGSMS